MAYSRQAVEESAFMNDVPPPPYTANAFVVVKNATNTTTATVATAIATTTTATTTVAATRLRAPQGYDYEDPSIQSYYSQSQSPAALPSQDRTQQGSSSEGIHDARRSDVVATVVDQVRNDDKPPKLPSRTKKSNNPQTLVSSLSSLSIEESVHRSQNTANALPQISMVQDVQAGPQEVTYHTHHQGDVGTVQSQAGCQQDTQPVIYQPPPVTCVWQQGQQQQQQQQQHWEQWQQQQQQQHHQSPPLSPPGSSPASPTVFVPHSTTVQQHQQLHQNAPTTPMIAASVPAQFPTHTPGTVAEQNPIIPMVQPAPIPAQPQPQPPALPARPPVAGPSLVTHYVCRECGARLASENAVCQRVHTQLSRPQEQSQAPGSNSILPEQQQQQQQYFPYPQQPQYHIPQQQQYQQHYQYQHPHLPQTIASPENNYGTNDVYLKRPQIAQPVVQGLKRLWLDAAARTGFQTQQQQAQFKHTVVTPSLPPRPLNVVNVAPHPLPQQQQQHQHQHQHSSYGYPHPQFHPHQYTAVRTGPATNGTANTAHTGAAYYPAQPTYPHPQTTHYPTPR